MKRKPKMHVTNLTDWDSADLNRVLSLAADAVGVSLPKMVLFKNGKTDVVRGRAVIGSVLTEGASAVATLQRMPPHDAPPRLRPLLFAGKAHHAVIWVPPPSICRMTPLLRAQELARVAEHELAHTLGIRHEEMERSVRLCEQAVEYVDGVTVHRKHG